MATANHRRTLRRAEAAAIRAMSDEQLQALTGTTPEQDEEYSRKVAHLSDETLEAAIDGDPVAERAVLIALYGPDKRKWPK